RDLYKVWDEGGQTPAVVMEITSKSTRKEDMGKKFQRYEQRLRVPEYFLFDPTGDYLSPTLQGYRLENGKYIRLPMQNDRLYSEQLKLDLVLQGELLRFYDPIKNLWLLSPEETQQLAEAEHQRAELERRRAEAAEAELARLRAELAALRSKDGI